MVNKKHKLILEDGSQFVGRSFGANKSISGEVVFATGMVGYPEALTDPSFRGQILVLTYPLVGNYGVPKKELWESAQIQVSGLLVCNYVDTPSHHAMKMTLSKWLQNEGVPALEVKDTRMLTQKLRTKGVMLGKINIKKTIAGFKDPNVKNLVAEVSTKKVQSFSPVHQGVEVSTKNIRNNTIVLIDCGTKQNIIRSLTMRGFRIVVVPWDTDVSKLRFSFSAVVISNGPGDPKMVRTTISNIKKIIKNKVPIFGICLGSQILTLALGGSTYKLKFGHRSQNQPVVDKKTGRCYLTTQNHGFAVKRIPKDCAEWFYNANDNTNEGIIHNKLPFMSVQFHPESSPGPMDTDWVFDYFLEKVGLLKGSKKT